MAKKSGVFKEKGKWYVYSENIRYGPDSEKEVKKTWKDIKRGKHPTKLATTKFIPTKPKKEHAPLKPLTMKPMKKMFVINKDYIVWEKAKGRDIEDILDDFPNLTPRQRLSRINHDKWGTYDTYKALPPDHPAMKLQRPKWKQLLDKIKNVGRNISNYYQKTGGIKKAKKIKAERLPKEKPTPTIKKAAIPYFASKIDQGLYTCSEIIKGGYGTKKIKNLKQDFKDLRTQWYQLEKSRETKAISNRAYQKSRKGLEKQAKEKLKKLGQLEEKVEEKAEKAESKKTSKVIESLGTLVKKTFKGTGDVVDNVEDFFKNYLGPPKLTKYAKKKKTQYVILLFILIIAAGAFFSISKPSTTSFIIFGQEDTLNYKLLAGTLLLILTIYLVRKKD